MLENIQNVYNWLDKTEEDNLYVFDNTNMLILTYIIRGPRVIFEFETYVKVNINTWSSRVKNTPVTSRSYNNQI